MCNSSAASVKLFLLTTTKNDFSLCSLSMTIVYLSRSASLARDCQVLLVETSGASIGTCLLGVTSITAKEHHHSVECGVSGLSEKRRHSALRRCENLLKHLSELTRPPTLRSGFATAQHLQRSLLSLVQLFCTKAASPPKNRRFFIFQ